MGNYNFYTPPLLAECLLKILPNREYHNIIDICCGSWNLLEAARNQFSMANFIGVDVDVESRKKCFRGATFLCKDGRKFAIEEKRKYDLILSNPPFGYLKEDERVLNNLDCSKELIKELINKRYENEMLQANLLLADKEGVLLFILPTTFLEGDTYLAIRKALCEKYTVDSIIKLPIETFGKSKISTFAMILINSGGQKKDTKLQEILCIDDKWEDRYLGNISAYKMREGIWLGKNRKKNAKDIKIFRGNISSIHMSTKGEKVFHNSSIVNDGIWEPSVRYCNDEKKIEKAKVVMPGDIIINRIGRYARYWCICKEKGMVSDCLIVVKVSEGLDIIESIMKNSINGKINVRVKGLSTKYITMSDILDLL